MKKKPKAILIMAGTVIVLVLLWLGYYFLSLKLLPLLPETFWKEVSFYCPDSGIRDKLTTLRILRGANVEIKKCHTMKGQNCRSFCIANVAIAQKDESLCESIAKSQYYPMCINLIAQAKRDPNLCQKIAKGDLSRDYCFETIAIELKDSSLCDEIISFSLQDHCKRSIRSLVPLPFP